MSRLKAVRPFNKGRIGLILRGSIPDSPLYGGLMSRTDHLRIQSFIVNVDGYKSRKSCFSAISHPPKTGAGWVAYWSFFNVSRGFDELFTTPLIVYYAHFKAFAQLTKTSDHTALS